MNTRSPDPRCRLLLLLYDRVRVQGRVRRGTAYLAPVWSHGWSLPPCAAQWRSMRDMAPQPQVVTADHMLGMCAVCGSLIGESSAVCACTLGMRKTEDGLDRVLTSCF